MTGEWGREIEKDARGKAKKTTHRTGNGKKRKRRSKL